MQHADNQEQSHPRISSSLTARRIAKMLFSDLLNDQPAQESENELLKAFLLWPADLFAFTSTVMSATGAYQLVVSPPGVQGSKALRLAHKSLVEDKDIVDSDINDFFCWPPQYDITKYTYKSSKKENLSEGNIETVDDNFLLNVIKSIKQTKNTKKRAWAKQMRAIGFKWRKLLEEQFDPSDLLKFKYGKLESDGTTLESNKLSEVRLKLLKKLCSASIDGGANNWVPTEVISIFEILIARFNKPEKEAYALTNNGYELNTIFDINCLESDEDERYQMRVKQLISEKISSIYNRQYELTEDEINSINKQAAIEYTNRLANNWIAFQALFSLHAIADEASIGLGIRRKFWIDKPKANKKSPRYKLKWLKDLKSDEITDLRRKNADNVFDFAENRLRKYGTLSNVHAHICRILPKRHTPELGITLRSVSNNLSYHRSSVDVQWRNWSTHKSKGGSKKIDNTLLDKLDNYKPNTPRALSVLLLPWPLEIKSNDFKEQSIGLLKDSSKAFAYSPDYDGDTEKRDEFKESFQKDLREAIKAAKTETNGKVDIVILPEGALLEGLVKAFEEICGENGVSMYIAGVRQPSDEKEGLSDNMAYFKMGDRTEQSDEVKYLPDDLREKGYYTQYKHHRWRLDYSQIVSYDLGNVLPPTLNWWEAIKIRRRRVTFINVGDELTICPLICEDLARQDPIAELLRAVAPSLVVTILMDGPQRKDRWSSRYATVLAEDPGCAVLTLTSYGMVRRWHPPYPPYLTDDVRPIIALWNDGHGTIREIETKPDSVGVLLSLTIGGEFELTADGRREFHRTNTLTLGSVHQVKKEKRVV